MQRMDTITRTAKLSPAQQAALDTLATGKATYMVSLSGSSYGLMLTGPEKFTTIKARTVAALESKGLVAVTRRKADGTPIFGVPSYEMGLTPAGRAAVQS